MYTYPLLGLLSFLLGSIPCGYLIGRLKGIDLRSSGSGNTGATNAARVLGKRAGVITLLCDAFKGGLTAYLAKLSYSYFSYTPTEDSIIALAGMFAILGHCFTPFLNFKGGKGVACGMGVYLVLAPIEMLLSLCIFIIMFISTKYVSLSSISAAIGVPMLFLFEVPERSLSATLFTMLSATIIIYRHHSNISRLFAGTEPKFSTSKQDTSSTG